MKSELNEWIKSSISIDIDILSTKTKIKPELQNI